MKNPLRGMLIASLIAAVALSAAACADFPGAETPSSTPKQETPDTSDDQQAAAAWVDEGRMFAILTWGSSTCVPLVESATAEGQTLTVDLVNAPEATACSADMAPRVSLGVVPGSIDAAKGVELIVREGEREDRFDLVAVSGTAPLGSETALVPTAAWLDDGLVVLVTWGSSTCVPVVESVEVANGGATVTFSDEDGPCTRDIVPRATLIAVDGTAAGEEFELTLVGATLDGSVEVSAR
ncbi:hypothetical protein M0722_17735 [Microbacterium sp. KSW4-16]|uniref:hypothetical protein n=1 Tax=Microbacterium aurugineum TaxID=2851642 RepID=UPI0020C0F952|nr:hypothetical protein [Microbacterium aurugineum]MCK8469042.1 hypothetical protein [Microbacterium aurugineum]